MAEQPGDRGRNWFAVELTSAFVDPGAVVVPASLIFVTNAGAIPSGEQFGGSEVVLGPAAITDVGNLGGIASGEQFSTAMNVTVVSPPPPEPDITVRGGPVPDSGQMVQAGPAFLREIIEGEFELVLPQPEPTLLSETHTASLALQQRVEEEHEGTLHLSNFMVTVRRDDEEFMLLF